MEERISLQIPGGGARKLATAWAKQVNTSSAAVTLYLQHRDDYDCSLQGSQTTLGRLDFHCIREKLTERQDSIKDQASS